MKTHIITTVIIIASTLFAYAEVELLNVSPASAGTCDGEAVIDASGTAGPFTILLDGEQVEEEVNGLYIVENLCSGTHTISVISRFGCENIIEFDVVECGDISITNIEAGITGVSSCDANDGRFAISYIPTLSVNGITGSPYTAILYDNNGAEVPNVNGLKIWENLGAGLHTLHITDANGCEGEVPVNISGSALWSSADITAECENSQNGSISVIASDGTYPPIPVTYSWNTGDFMQTTDPVTLDNLSAGLYSVTISSSSGCTKVEQYEVEGLTSSTSLSISNLEIDNTCPGEGDGKISFDVTGGIPLPPPSGRDYRIHWDSHEGTGSYSSNRRYLPAGDYCVTITDFCENRIEECFTVGKHAPVEVAVEEGGIQNSCNNDPSGAVYINVSSGTPPYSYIWSNGTTEEDLTEVVPGWYSVIVSDGNACEDQLETFVPGVEIYGAVANDYVNSNCKGFIGIVTTDYIDKNLLKLYKENPQGVFSEEIELAETNNSYAYQGSSLEAGTYKVVYDDPNCPFEQVLEVHEADPIDIGFDIKPVGECGDYSAELTVTVSGGRGGCFLLSSEDITGLQLLSETSYGTTQNDYEIDELCVVRDEHIFNIGNLPAGDYCFKVEDLSCGLTECVTIPERFNLESAEIGNTCNDKGYIRLGIESKEDYTIAWSNGETNKDIYFLSPGEYCVTITAADIDCAISRCYQVEEELDLQLEVNNHENSATVQLDNGSNYAYELKTIGGQLVSSGNTTNEELLFNNLSMGEYELIVSSNSCSKTVLFSINDCTYNALAISLEAEVTPLSLPGSSDGQIDLEAELVSFPGQGPMSSSLYYNWFSTNGFSSTDEDISNLSTGKYCVVVSDGCGTIATECMEIKSCADTPFAFFTNDEPCAVSGLTDEYLAEINYSPAPGYSSPTAEEITQGWLQVSLYGHEAPLQYSWNKQSSQGAWLSIEGETSDILETNLAGNYMVEVFEANSGCTYQYETYLEYGFDESDYGWVPESNNCFMINKCNGRVYFYGQESAEITFVNNTLDYNDPNPCKAYVYCPLGGGDLFPPEYIEGEVTSRTVLGPSGYPSGYCVVEVNCSFFNGSIEGTTQVLSNTDVCPRHSDPEDVGESEEGGDYDNDGINDEDDPCPTISNPDPSLLDVDEDEDGIVDACDNCKPQECHNAFCLSYNPSQIDSDGDGVGNPCDLCPGSVPDPSKHQSIIGELEDDDGDGIGNNCDNCALFYNPSQCDRDNDGIGDLCDPDDCPGLPVTQDCCPIALVEDGSGNASAISSEVEQVQLTAIEAYATDKQVSTFKVVNVYPNPFKNTLNLSIECNLAGIYKIVLLDILGRPVHSHNENLAKGSHIISLNPPQQIPSGIYQLVIWGANNEKNVWKVLHNN